MYTRTWQHTKKQDKVWSFKKAVKLYQIKEIRQNTSILLVINSTNWL